MRGSEPAGGVRAGSKLDTHSSPSTAPSSSSRAAPKRSGSCSSPPGPARVRSGRPVSQVWTCCAVVAPSLPPSAKLAARSTR
jgi:hypothetical protein